MLQVWCVCVGDKYTSSDVYTLYSMVRSNLVQPFNFNCLTDRDLQIPEIDCHVLQNAEVYPGWWAKILLFDTDLADSFPCLYLDLDVVVVGNLDRLVSRQLSMPANWGQSGHGGCQSSVMSWGEQYNVIHALFNPSHIEPGPDSPYGRFCGFWGDQEYITDLMGPPGFNGEILPMKHVYSYKYHCQQEVPADASVIAFHGDPKPDKVQAPWIQQARRLSTQTLH